MDVTIVIPVYNQIAYTQGCLRCLAPDIAEGVTVVVVNNGSTDGTREWLDQQKGIKVIHNSANRGCAAAWNQGYKAVPADWTIILNNDVLLPTGWRSTLLGAADRASLDIVSPAMREGEMNYDLEEHAHEFTHHMSRVVRPGGAHGVCFAVRRKVFAQIGGFDEAFRIGQFEDADFFRHAGGAGFALGITGGCFIHHFGSVTQNTLRSGPAVGPYEAENRAYFRKKWRLSWVRRRWERTLMTVCLWAWRTREKKVSGHTLHEKWQAGRLQFY
jgi:N-acetylglucosaminyl-diphospho-decaprenol L-rhamnosyltransferase